MFLIFYLSDNKANIHNIIIDVIQVSKMGLTTFLAQLVSILRAKLQKVVIRGKDGTFLIFGHFFSK